VATVITHALVGVSLATAAPAAARGPRLVLALAALSVLPDADVIGFQLGIPYGHPLGHRGFTHSLLFSLGAGLAVARSGFGGLAPGSRDFRRVAGLLVLATVSHGVLDAFTDAGRGIGFFIPFDNARIFFPWRPLVTSPLEARAFLDGRATSILANEALWVWLPLGVVLLGLRLGRGRRND